jgi:osmotically-inducible protein OsmY
MTVSIKPITGDELGQAVFFHLKERSDLDIGDLSVKAEGSVVTLEGYVNSREKKKAAEQTAMEVRGVKAVASDITIKPVLERTDTELARNVIRAFQSHGSVPAEQVKVIVSNGRITLEGVVSTVLERMLAEAVAKNLPGVVGVQNDLLVQPRSSLTRQQETAPQEEVVFSSNREAETKRSATKAG